MKKFIIGSLVGGVIGFAYGFGWTFIKETMAHGEALVEDNPRQEVLELCEHEMGIYTMLRDAKKRIEEAKSA